MNYKEKLNASQAQAHNQNIATKILRDLNKLRSTVEEDKSNSRRWIWELIQNAKDVASSSGVSIKIVREKDDTFVFSHNGLPFKSDNIRYLVEQISTKDQENEDASGKRKTTGRFGTGFLTTHLLSEIVTVRGVLKDDNLPYKQFKVILDRSGHTNRDIIDSVQKSRNILNQVDNLPDFSAYNEESFNTKFSYPIRDELGLKVYKEGIEDLKNSIGYVLCLNQEIKEVFFGSKGNRAYKADTVNISENGYIFEIRRVIRHETHKEFFAVFSNEYTSIVIPIQKYNEGCKIIEIDEGVSSLFCQFPLVGSDSFKFPAIINNPNFNPTEPRDGLYLTNPQRENPLIIQNKRYIAEAVSLYGQFVKYAIENKWGNLHLLAKIKTQNYYQSWLSKNFFESSIVDVIRNIIKKSKIMISASGHLIPLFDEYNRTYAKIPKIGSKKLRDKLWRKGCDLFSNNLPIAQQLDFWAKYSWDKCEKFDATSLCKFIESAGKFETIKEMISDADIYEWLDSFYSLLKEDENKYDRLINNYKIFPNQNGVFVKWNGLFLQNGEIQEVFKNILCELGEDIRESTLDEKINFVAYEGQSEITEEYITGQINSLSIKYANDREVSRKYRIAFNLILKYFRESEKEARVKFPTLYKDKYLLFDEDEMIANVEKVEKLDSLLSEFNLTSVTDIRKVLNRLSIQEQNSNELLPITSEIISSLGIKDLSEWKEAMKDKDLAKLFDHKSVPTTDMFIAAATFIEKAKKAIIEHLKTLEKYDISEAEFTSTTTLGGVKKNNGDIDIVCRPAYKNEVIIYYQAEKDVLDYQDSELWIDSKFGVKRISLGHILKTAQIHKFPV